MHTKSRNEIDETECGQPLRRICAGTRDRGVWRARTARRNIGQERYESQETQRPAKCNPEDLPEADGERRHVERQVRVRDHEEERAEALEHLGEQVPEQPHARRQIRHLNNE